MRLRVVAIGLVWAAAAIACATAAEETITADTGPVTTVVSPASTLPPVVDCPGTGDFEEGTGIAELDSVDSDASDLGGISWNQTDQCETFTFEFETAEGAPATTVPGIDVSHLPSFQVIRISMDIDASAITDQLVETGLVDRLYAVRGLNGGMFVDLHLRSPAAARISVGSSPAVLLVDLRPGLIEFTGQSVIHDRVVVVSPGTSSAIGVNTTFSGYSRASDGDVSLIVTSGNEVVSHTTAISAGDGETWGEFDVDLTLPQGDMSVFLGEENPDDSSLEGVTLDVTVR